MQDCPTPETLEQLLLGQLSAEVSEGLEEHLFECSSCVRQAELQRGEDDLVVALRAGAAQGVASISKSNVRDLVQRVRNIQLDTATYEKDTTASIAAVKTTDADITDYDLPGYTIQAKIGEGGMGVVLRAFDETLKRPVAIKLMKTSLASDDTARQRFLREAQAMAAVNHDNIVKVFRVSDDDDASFLAMEYLRGESLQERLDREDRCSLTTVLRLGRQLAEGIAAAHATGLCHRDIKPSNIWLEEETDRVKILDFGLAFWNEQDVNLTQSGMIVGTPRYMAPEQAKGEPVDSRADLFSIGIVLYQMLTGRTPFRGRNLAATLLAVVNHQPRSVVDIDSSIPVVLSHTVDELLIKDPARRLASADELVQRLAMLEFQLAESELDAQIPIATVVAAPWWRIAFVASVVAIVALSLVAKIQRPAESSPSEVVRPSVTSAINIDPVEQVSSNVLDAINFEAATRSGAWTRDPETGDVLCVARRSEFEGTDDYQAKLLVPRRIETSYRAVMDFTWGSTTTTTTDSHGLGMNLPVGGTCISLGITPRGQTWLGFIKGQPGSQNGTLTSNPELTVGKRHQVEATVIVYEQSAEIRVAFNGQACLGWKGPMSSLSNGNTWHGGNRTYRRDMGISLSPPSYGKEEVSVRIHNLTVKAIAIPRSLAINNASWLISNTDALQATPPWPSKLGIPDYAQFAVGQWTPIKLSDDQIKLWRRGQEAKQVTVDRKGTVHVDGPESNGIALPDMTLDNVLVRARVVPGNDSAADDYFGLAVRVSPGKSKLCKWYPSGAIELGNDGVGWYPLASKAFAEPITEECEIVIAAIHGHTSCYVNGRQVLSYTQPFRTPGSVRLKSQGRFTIHQLEVMPLDEIADQVPTVVFSPDTLPKTSNSNDYDELARGEWKRVVWRDELLSNMRKLDQGQHSITRMDDGSLEVFGTGPASWPIDDPGNGNVLVRATVVQIDGTLAIGLRGIEQSRYRIEVSAATSRSGTLDLWDANVKQRPLAHRGYRSVDTEYELAVAAVDDIISVFINGKHAMEYQSAEVVPGLVMLGCDGPINFANVELMELE